LYLKYFLCTYTFPESLRLTSTVKKKFRRSSNSAFWEAVQARAVFAWAEGRSLADGSLFYLKNNTSLMLVGAIL
jgi:hypothetical protein